MRLKTVRPSTLTGVAIGNLTYEEGTLTKRPRERIFNDGIMPGDPIVTKKVLDLRLDGWKTQHFRVILTRNCRP